MFEDGEKDLDAWFVKVVDPKVYTGMHRVSWWAYRRNAVKWRDKPSCVMTFLILHHCCEPLLGHVDFMSVARVWCTLVSDR